mgnify:CR=1 FL=1
MGWDRGARRDLTVAAFGASDTALYSDSYRQVYRFAVSGYGSVTVIVAREQATCGTYWPSVEVPSVLRTHSAASRPLQSDEEREFFIRLERHAQRADYLQDLCAGFTCRPAPAPTSRAPGKSESWRARALGHR